MKCFGYYHESDVIFMILRMLLCVDCSQGHIFFYFISSLFVAYNQNIMTVQDCKTDAIECCSNFHACHSSKGALPDQTVGIVFHFFSSKRSIMMGKHGFISIFEIILLKAQFSGT